MGFRVDVRSRQLTLGGYGRPELSISTVPTGEAPDDIRAHADSDLLRRDTEGLRLHRVRIAGSTQHIGQMLVHVWETGLDGEAQSEAPSYTETVPSPPHEQQTWTTYEHMAVAAVLHYVTEPPIAAQHAA